MENGIVNVANGLAAKGVEMGVACLSDRGAFADRLPAPERVKVLGKKAGFSIGAIRELGKFISDWRPELVHTHNLGPLVYAGFATLGGRTVPVLHGEHGQIQKQDLTPRRVALRRLAYRSAHTVHTVSSGLIATLRQQGFEAPRMAAVVNGVDCNRFKPVHDRSAVRSHLGLPGGDRLVLGIVGRFVALKRHLMLFEALETVMARHPLLHLMVLGDDGEEKGRIVDAMAGHPFHERIHWLGMRSDMNRCYQAMDLLVVPSEIEGLSNAVLEAMACGVPALAHVACGNGEAITNNVDGILRDLADAKTLAVAIDEAVADQARLKEMGERARQTMIERFSLDAMAENYLRLYQAIIDDDRPR